MTAIFLINALKAHAKVYTLNQTAQAKVNI
jgi:hypothetical protein